jgi:hypothetical protein
MAFERMLLVKLLKNDSNPRLLHNLLFKHYFFGENDYGIAMKVNAIILEVPRFGVYWLLFNRYYLA